MARYFEFAVLMLAGLLPVPSVFADDAESAGPDGFALASQDGNYALKIRGLLQLDGRYFAADAALDDDGGFLLRRARLTFDGTFGPRIAFRLRPEASNGMTRVIDAYVDAKLGEHLSLRAGKFKPPVGLELLQAANELRVIERSLVTELVPSRDVGLQLSGSAGPVAWALGAFNGVPDGRNDEVSDDGAPELAARVFLEPFDSNRAGDTVFGIGIGASTGNRDGATDRTLLNSYRSPGQNAIFSYRGGADATFADGGRWRLSPQAYWYRGAFGVLGEWLRVSHAVRRAAADRTADLVHDAWQVTGEWTITGEPAAYAGASAAGAIQLVARIEGLAVDDAAFTGSADSFADSAVAVRRARSAALGINWFPLPGLKASLAYYHTAFDGGAPGGDRADENALLARLQLAF